MGKDAIERSLHYYDFDLVSFDQETAKLRKVSNLKEILVDLFNKISKLSFQEKQTDTNTGDNLFMIIDDLDESKNLVKYRLVLVKKNAFPLVEKKWAPSKFRRLFGPESKHCRDNA